MNLHPDNYTTEQRAALEKAAWLLSDLAAVGALGEPDRLAVLSGLNAVRAILAPNAEMRRAASNRALAHADAAAKELAA